MFDVFDTDVLFYNVFGYMQIEKDEIHLRATAVKLTKVVNLLEKNNRMTVPNDMKEFKKPFIIAFGAWVMSDKEIRFAVGDMDEYDQETYMLNQKYLDDLIKSISGRFNRIMDKPNE